MDQRFFILFVVAFLGLTGCKPAKDSGKDYSGKVGNKKTNLIVEQIQKNESGYPKALSFKAATEMTSLGKTTSFKAQVRMVSDSVIWVSITAYSYEVARILATPDSVKYFSRTDKKFYTGNYDFITKKLGVKFDFYDLQSLILAHSFGLNDIEKIRRSNSKNRYVLSSVKQGQLKRLEKGKGDWNDEFEVVYTNWVNPDTYKIERVELLNMINQNKASIQYSAFENIEQYVVLSAFKMNIIAEKNSEISSSFSKITVNTPLKFPFKISSKYEQIQ